MLPKHPLLQKCLAQLEALPHLKVKSEVEKAPYVGKTVIADGQITIDSPQGSVTYVVEIKTNVTTSNLAETTAYLKTLKERLPSQHRLLLIVEKLSNLTIKGLIERDFEFIDAAGNCYLKRWELGYTETLRPKLLLGTYTPASGV